MALLDAAINALYRYVDQRVADVRPFRAIVIGQASGMVQVRRIGDPGSGETALRARVAGADLATNDEVLCTPVAGGIPVVVGKLQRSRPSLPRRRTRREVVAYHSAATASSWAVTGWRDNPTLSATTYSNADTSGGAFLQLATSATANNVASIVGGGGTNSAVWLSWQPDISFGVRVPNTITSIRQWYGLFGASPAASDDPAVEGFGFRFSTNASDANFMAWCNDGTGGGTITDTGIAVQANYVQDLRCIVNTAYDAIDYYIDGAWVARHTTDLPGASTPLTYSIYCTTLTTAARALRWGRITVESRP